MMPPTDAAPFTGGSQQTRFQFAQDALVTDARFNLGMYRDPFKTVNPLDARIGLIPLSRGIKNAMLKEWEHFALVNRRFFVSVALFNAKRLGLAHVVVYDWQNRTKVIHEKRVRAKALEIPSDLWDSTARAVLPNLRIEMRHVLNEGVHRIEFLGERARGRPSIQGVFECYEDLSVIEPLVVCLPLGKRRAMYSHKAMLPVLGQLRVGKETFIFSKEDSFAMPDIHKGYYPYVMRWHWATGGGRDRFGRLIGFNLTNNQVKDQRTYNENCLWVDGKAHLLPPVRFAMDSRTIEHPWRIRDEEGRVDIEFQPEATRNINLNLLLVRSRYRGPYGVFTGTILDSNDTPVSVDHCFGMAEDFYLRG